MGSGGGGGGVGSVLTSITFGSGGAGKTGTGEGSGSGSGNDGGFPAVSYTSLTLPTTASVSVPVVVWPGKQLYLTHTSEHESC